MADVGAGADMAPAQSVSVNSRDAADAAQGKWSTPRPRPQN